jgi:hypothetical protein
MCIWVILTSPAFSLFMHRKVVKTFLYRGQYPSHYLIVLATLIYYSAWNHSGNDAGVVSGGLP